MHSRIIMDVDDVISTHRNRDYENAIPNLPIIKKMQTLASQGVDFVLFTARGQVSCNGDIKKIEETKGPVLKAWLKKYNVPYSELRFGKPIGDVYVDDAAMTPDEFLNGAFVSYKGGSNEYIEQLGKYVVKECKNVDAMAVSDWFEKANSCGYNVPKVYARTYNKMRMECIDGIPGNIVLFNENPNFAKTMAMMIIGFAGISGKYEFDVDDYNRYIETNSLDYISTKYVRIAEGLLSTYGYRITPTFCHGDLTTMNTIIKEDGSIYMIDPIPYNTFSSYLIDLAKLRMSLNGYNALFYNEDMEYSDKCHLEVLDRLLININLYGIVRVLEFTCWVRLIKYRYNNKSQYNKVLQRLIELSKEVDKL